MSRSITTDAELITREKFLNTLADTYLLHEEIINSTDLAVISATTEGIITSFNPAAEKLLGYTREELIGRWTIELLHDNIELTVRSAELSLELSNTIEPGFETLIAKAKTTKTAERKEWTYIRKDGTRFSAIVSISGIQNDQGEIHGYLAIATDNTEQRKNDETIRRSESHFQALLSSLDDIVLEVNRQGVYTNLWTRNDHLLFVERDRYIGKTLPEILRGPLSHLFPLFNRAIINVFETRQSAYLEYEVPGKHPWRSSRISYINDETVLILVRDITQIKLAEQKIQEREQRFRLLAENLPGIIYLCKNDATYSMEYLNERVEEITGYTVREFINGDVNFVQLYHPDDAPAIFREVEKAILNKTSFSLEYRLKHKNGSWLWIEELGAGIYRNDKLVMLEGILCNVTDRKISEEKISKISKEYDRVFNHSISLSVIAGFDGYFKKLNPVWEKIFGYELHELTTTPFIDFVHPQDKEPTIEATKILALGNNIATFENRYRCKDGTYRTLLWSSSSDVSNQVIYASAIDITERKKIEEALWLSKTNLETATEELQEQNRQLNEFAHIISHNLRSPVGNIKALVSLLNEESSLEDFREIFTKLKNTSINLQETLNELMETLHVKKEAGGERQFVRFEETISKVKQDLSAEILQSNAQIITHFEMDAIHYSKAYLESIMLNLMSNSLKYRSPKLQPQIHIQTKNTDRGVVLAVTDNGLGIDMDRHKDKIFGLRKTFHEHKDAKGVGLFLTKTQVEASGGKIWLESEVGKGTTVYVLF